MPLDFSGFELLSPIKWEGVIYHLSNQTQQVVGKFQMRTVSGRFTENRTAKRMQLWADNMGSGDSVQALIPGAGCSSRKVRPKEVQGQQPERGDLGTPSIGNTDGETEKWNGVVSNKQILSLIILMTDVIYLIPGVTRETKIGVFAKAKVSEGKYAESPYSMYKVK